MCTGFGAGAPGAAATFRGDSRRSGCIFETFGLYSKNEYRHGFVVGCTPAASRQLARPRAGRFAAAPRALKNPPHNSVCLVPLKIRGKPVFAVVTCSHERTRPSPSMSSTGEEMNQICNLPPYESNAALHPMRGTPAVVAGVAGSRRPGGRGVDLPWCGVFPPVFSAGIHLFKLMTYDVSLRRAK